MADETSVLLKMHGLLPLGDEGLYRMLAGRCRNCQTQESPAPFVACVLAPLKVAEQRSNGMSSTSSFVAVVLNMNACQRVIWLSNRNGAQAFGSISPDARFDEQPHVQRDWSSRFMFPVKMLTSSIVAKFKPDAQH